MRQHPEPRPRDDRDAVQDIARDLAEIASHIGQLKGEANAYLSDPNYDRLKLRLENALFAVEAAAVEARRLREEARQQSPAICEIAPGAQLRRVLCGPTGVPRASL